MLSRLKGIETQLFDQLTDCDLFCSDMLSRLKGIETFAANSVGLQRSLQFRYAFPFEGN